MPDYSKYAKEAVERGVDLLDERVPEWRTKIDVFTLRMSEPDRCVLGQLFGGYSEGVAELRLSGNQDPCRMGFDIYDGYTSYEYLQTAWKEALSP